jgi:Na+/glutamate symporter
MDVFISMLGALVIGGVVWAGGFGTVAALNYAGEMFQIYPPANQLINTAIQIGYVAGPILAGLLAAWLAYRFLLKLD